MTQRRFAFYVCCEALGSIKHLKIHKEHFQEPKHSFTVGKIKKWAVFNPPTVTWLLKAQRGEMSHDLSLHLPHVDICMKLNETKSKSNIFFPLCWNLYGFLLPDGNITEMISNFVFKTKNGYSPHILWPESHPLSFRCLNKHPKRFQDIFYNI